MGEYLGGWTGVMALLYFVWLFFLFTPWIFPATAAYFALLFAGRAQVWGFYLLHIYDKVVQLPDPATPVTVLNALKIYKLKLPAADLALHKAYEARHLSALAFESKAMIGVPVLTAVLFVLLFVVVPRVRRGNR